MELLKNKILEYGTVLSDNVLKVDSFLNHCVDVPLMVKSGEEIARRFKNDNVTKVLTVESSGIAPAFATAQILGADLVFSRKNMSLTLNKNSADLVTTEIFSYTKNTSCTIYISKKYIKPTDNVLIVDDFLANGEVCNGLIKLLTEIGANIVGFGIIIEKSFQKGRDLVEAQGYRVESLARIKSLANNKVEFL